MSRSNRLPVRKLSTQSSPMGRASLIGFSLVLGGSIFALSGWFFEKPVTAAVASSKAAESKVTDYGLSQVKKINDEISQVWKDNGLIAAAPATEGEWCRRVYLDIIGRIPSVDELKDFANDKDANKKAKLVTKILFDEKYVEEYARNWTSIWTNILIGRNGGNDRNTMINRSGMQKYLRDSFARNKPYDVMVRELVTATGNANPGEKDFNGAVNFLIQKVNEEKATLATADTTKIFLGLQVQCTQCHNHPFNDWKQQKFWEMNAFFRQTRARRGEQNQKLRRYESAELFDEDFAGEDRDASKAVIYYELRNGLLKSAYPIFVDGTPVGESGYLSDVNRRQLLGDMIVKSEFMDKSIVNRVWAHFLGYGFTKPIDDLGPHNAPTHPALLEYLGKEFRGASFNLKELIRWITLSEPYSISSRITSSNKADDPLMGESPKFSHFYMRNMRAEELYESLLVATEAHKTKGSYEDQEKSKNDWMKQFVIAFGTDEGAEATTFNGTIPQALMMFNGELVKKATNSEKGSFLANIAADGRLKAPDKIRHLFVAALGRVPNNRELEIANKLLMARNGDTTAALQDIFWAVLNSNEFIINH